jgi:transcription elongation factor GreA
MASVPGEAARGLNGGARDRLKQELAALRERREEMAAEIRSRDPVGDQADNAFALRLGDEIAALDARIANLTELLARGHGVEGIPDGTRVRLRFDDGTEQTLQVVAVIEEIPAGQEDDTITADSPLGLALVGHGAGDSISYRAPVGEVHADILSLELP